MEDIEFKVVYVDEYIEGIVTEDNIIFYDYEYNEFDDVPENPYDEGKCYDQYVDYEVIREECENIKEYILSNKNKSEIVLDEKEYGKVILKIIK